MIRELLQPIYQSMLRLHARWQAPRMVYGLRSADGAWRPHSRISTHACVVERSRLRVGDHVYIGHFNLLDASGGLDVGEGCQITSHVAVLTHSSHQSLRLEREAYWGHADPAGVVRGATTLGAWCFVGPHSVIAPGTQLGRGVLVKAHAYVGGEVPDFAVLEGKPARVVGDTRELDRAWIERHASVYGVQARAAYEAWVDGTAR